MTLHITEHLTPDAARQVALHHATQLACAGGTPNIVETATEILDFLQAPPISEITAKDALRLTVE